MLKRFFVFTALFLSAVVWADDTDMYFTNPVTIPTRVMLLLDTSGSINDDLAGCDTGERNDCDTSKIDLARNTLVTLLTGPDQWDDTTEIGLSPYFSRGEVREKIVHEDHTARFRDAQVAFCRASSRRRFAPDLRFNCFRPSSKVARS